MYSVTNMRKEGLGTLAVRPWHLHIPNVCRANQNTAVTWLPSSSPQGNIFRAGSGMRAHTTHAHIWISHILVVFNAFCLMTMSCDCIPACHGLTVRVLRPTFHVLVMEYIQRCGKVNLVHKTTWSAVLQRKPTSFADSLLWSVMSQSSYKTYR